MITDSEAPDFPPLLRGEAGVGDPLVRAVALARAGTDPGMIVHDIRPDNLSAALILAPEVPLAKAMAMVIAAANAFGDAFGALAPSEVAVHFDWPGGIRINGARCGGLRAAASTYDADSEPDWLVIALEVPFFAPATTEPGEDPDRTTLWEEGCTDIAPRRLLESWSRHLLVWINHWSETGMNRLHRDWMGRAAQVGKEVSIPGVGEGTFLGLDEDGGMILKTGADTRIVPLIAMLETSC